MLFSPRWSRKGIDALNGQWPVGEILTKLARIEFVRPVQATRITRQTTLRYFCLALPFTCVQYGCLEILI